MLTNNQAFSSFSVNNLQDAKDFYADVLGINVADGEMPGMFNLEFGNGSRAMVYEKDNHEPATFTILNFLVEDIEQTVDELTSRGIVFEIYDEDELKTDEKGIARGNGPTIAWFKDPAGNFVALIEE